MTALALPFSRSRSRATGGRAYERRPRLLPLLFFVAACVSLLFAMTFLPLSLACAASEIA